MQTHGLSRSQNSALTLTFPSIEHDFLLVAIWFPQRKCSSLTARSIFLHARTLTLNIFQCPPAQVARNMIELLTLHLSADCWAAGRPREHFFTLFSDDEKKNWENFSLDLQCDEKEQKKIRIATRSRISRISRCLLGLALRVGVQSSNFRWIFTTCTLANASFLRFSFQLRYQNFKMRVLNWVLKLRIPRNRLRIRTREKPLKLEQPTVLVYARWIEIVHNETLFFFWCKFHTFTTFVRCRS